MTILKQAQLALAKEPLQISYPKDFTGTKSSPDEEAIFINTEPAFYSVDEILLIEDYLLKLPYPQRLALTGCVLLSPNDSLLEKDHNYIDEIEARNGFPSTKQAPGGGIRSLTERVLILREQGYYGNGSLAIAPSSSHK